MTLKMIRLSYEEFIQLEKLDADQPDLWLQSINSVEADDIASIHQALQVLQKEL